jgi:hypothetical protein
MAKKKIKKFLKNAAKVGGALMLGKALMGKKYNTSPVSVDSGRGSKLRNILKSAMPGNLSKSMGPYRDNTGEGAYTLANPRWENWDANYYKKGGRVKLAKRGLGRAFTKRKK